MKKVFFLLLLTSLFISVLAKDSSSCYNVQLLSAYKYDKDVDKLLTMKYADNCKVIELGNSFALRCGCFDKMKGVKKELKKYKTKYKNAYISTTYTSRFEDKTAVKKVEPVTIVQATSIVPASLIAKETFKKKTTIPIQAIVTPKKQKIIKPKLVERDVKHYKEGISYYKNHDFKNSYETFSKIYLENLNDVNFNFYFGRSAYETGHYAMALAAFERVEMQDGRNLRNKLEMARTYYMLKMYEDSENAFKDVLANPNIPKNIRTNIELSLSKVSKVQQKSFTYAQVMMNIMYDSNVNYGSIGDYQYGGGTLDRIDEISDFALQGYINVTNIYDIGDKNGFAIKNSFNFFIKEYFNEDDYNIMYFNYNPSLLYKETKYSAEFLLGLDSMMVGRKTYLNSVSFTPKIQYHHTDSLTSIAYVKYQEKKFIQEAQHSLDASRYELSYGLQDILSPRSYLEGNLLIASERKKGGTNINVDFDEYKLNLTYSKQFTTKYNLHTFVQLRKRDYKDFSSGFGSIRKDMGGVLNADITRNIIPTIRANVKASFEYVDSNQDRFTYQKYTVTAGIVKTF